MATRRVGPHGHFGVWNVIFTLLCLAPMFTLWKLVGLHLCRSQTPWVRSTGEAMLFQL